MRDPRFQVQQVGGSTSTLRGGIGRRTRRRRLERGYWDFFVNTAPSDPLNLMSGSIREAPEGPINSVKNDVHTPEIMSEHVRQIGMKLGADDVGIVALDPSKDRPPKVPQEAKSAVICIMPAPYDPETALGIGGQVPVQDGLMISFILCAFFRESGYFANMRAGTQSELVDLAVRANLGTIDQQGRLHTAHHRSRVWVADIVYTDFPLAARS